MDQMELRTNQKILQEILGLIESKKYKNAHKKLIEAQNTFKSENLNGEVI